MRDSIQNVVDFLYEAKLTIATSTISESDNFVSWHPTRKGIPFLRSDDDIDVDQYISWIDAGHYTCILFDGSLLQLSYSIDGRQISGHRLAFIPCPWLLDMNYLDEGFSLQEILEIHSSNAVRMKSAVRFDLDISAAKRGHPASHLTFNSNDCRIACLAPITPLRFVDFIFKNFYAFYWSRHRSYFSTARSSHLAIPVIGDDERDDIHISWNPYAA